MTEWFERWFGEEYLRLYPHRNEEDARQVVDLIATHVPLERRRVLDLGCGPGRHAAHLSRRGAAVVGLDLSMTLLRRARELHAPATGFVRGDMRCLPFRAGAFQVAVNLFTSYGYFTDERDDARVLREAAQVLSARGTLVLDYFHAVAVRRGLVSQEEQQVGAQRVVIERSISPDGRWVVKDMHLGDRSFQERVRLYQPADLERLLVGAGFSVTHRFGAYDGRQLADDSPRAIFVAHRAS